MISMLPNNPNKHPLAFSLTEKDSLLKLRLLRLINRLPLLRQCLSLKQWRNLHLPGSPRLLLRMSHNLMPQPQLLSLLTVAKTAATAVAVAALAMAAATAMVLNAPTTAMGTAVAVAPADNAASANRL